MSELKKKSKTAFEVWQSTVLEAYKNLPKAPNMREYSNEISRIRKRKEWVKFVDAQVPEKKLEELKQKLKEWFMELGGWLMSSEVRSKLRGWNKLDLPKEMKEKFEELLKEEKEA